ncbi:MAG: diguanylate cyclase [Pseudomonadota bacterium]|nr:diguanylate cyclase [Pseudomonadota bacterium]
MDPMYYPLIRGWAFLIGLLWFLPTSPLLAGQAPWQMQQAYLPDPSGELVMEDILANHLPWRPAPRTGVVEQGYRPGALWLRFSLTITEPLSLPLYVELGSPFLNQVDGTLVRGNRVIHVAPAGDHRPLRDNHLGHRYPLLPLPLTQPGDYILYLRVASDSPLIFPVRFKRTSALFRAELKAQAFYGSLLGIMLVLALYSGSVWYYLREPAYLYNMAFILAAMFYLASFSGLGYQYLWGNWVLLNDKSFALGILSTVFFAGRFAVRFIDLRAHLPRLAVATDMFVALFGLMMIPALLLPESQVALPVLVLEAAICIYALAVLLQQCLAGNYWARYLLAGWAVLIPGTLLYVVSMLGWIPHQPWVEYSHGAGLALGNVVLTLALGARIQRERQEKKRALKQALDLAREVTDLTREKEQIAASARDELERRVDQKTQDLSTMLEQLKTSNQKLEHATLTDALTGVGNRRYLDSRFPELIRQCQQTRSALGVLVIDADHFKRINDQYGHVMGDECLKKIALILQRFARRDLDVLVRYGGEEFILLTPATDEAAAMKVAEAIRQHIQYAAFWYRDQPIPVTVSVGVHVSVPGAQVDPEGLLVKADEAMYRAKKNGRNRVEQSRCGDKTASA